MKNKSTVILLGLLAAAIISGLILFDKFQNRNDAFLESEKKVISLEEKVSQLNQAASSLKERTSKETEENLKQLQAARARISELENVVNKNNQKIAELNENISRLINKHMEEKGALENQVSQLTSANEARASKYVQEIQNRDIEINDYKGKITEAVSRIAVLKQEIEMLKNDLNIQKEQNVKVDTQMEQLKSTNSAEISHLNAEIESRDVTIVEFREENESLSSQLLLKNEQVSKFKNEIEQLQTLVSDREREKMEVDVQLEELRLTHDDFFSEIAKETTQLSNSISALSKQYRDLMSPMPFLEEIEKKLIEMKTIQRKLLDLEKQRDEAKTLTDRLKSNHELLTYYLREEILLRDNAVAALIKQLEDEISQVFNLKESLEKRQAEIEELHIKISDLQKQKDAVDIQLAELKSVYEVSISTNQTEIQNRDAKIDNLQNQIMSTKRQVTSQQQDIEKGQNKIEGLKQALLIQKEQNIAVETELEQMKSTHEATVSGLNAEISNRDTMIAGLRERNKDVLSQLQLQEEQTNKTIREMENLRLKYSALEKQKDAIHNQLTQFKSAHNAGISEYKKEIQNREMEINDLQRQVMSLKSQVTSQQQDIEKGQNEIAGLKQAFLNQKEQNITVETELEQLKSTHENTVSGLNAEISNRDTMIAGLRERNTDTLSQLRLQEEQINNTRNEMEKLLIIFSDLQKQKDAVDIQLVQLKSAHEASVSKYKTEIQNRDAKIDNLQGQVMSTKRQVTSMYQEVEKRKLEKDEIKRRLLDLLGEHDQLETQIEEVKSIHETMISDLKSQIQNKDVAIHELEKKLSITFVDRILFESGKANITAKGQALLEKVGDSLKNIRAKRIRVVGHTDNKLILPENRYIFPSNWELSSARAAAVVRFFQKHIGINPQNMEAVGQSFYNPVATNDTEEGRRQNRRVAIIISPNLD